MWQGLVEFFSATCERVDGVRKIKKTAPKIYYDYLRASPDNNLYGCVADVLRRQRTESTRAERILTSAHNVHAERTPRVYKYNPWRMAHACSSKYRKETYETYENFYHVAS